MRFPCPALVLMVAAIVRVYIDYQGGLSPDTLDFVRDTLSPRNHLASPRFRSPVIRHALCSC